MPDPLPDQDRAYLAEILRKLSEVNERLGTPAERTDDFETARKLAHQFTNKLQPFCISPHLRHQLVRFYAPPAAAPQRPA